MDLAFTSLRSCSAAWLVFFRGHALTMQAVPNRANREMLVVFLHKAFLDLVQGAVRLFVDPDEDFS